MEYEIDRLLDIQLPQFYYPLSFLRLNNKNAILKNRRIVVKNEKKIFSKSNFRKQQK